MRTGILCLIGLLACNSKPDVVEPSNDVRLNTAPHEEDGLSWEGSPIEADTRWRFLSSRETDEGFDVTGAWEITLRNTSGFDIQIASLELANSISTMNLWASFEISD